MTQNGLLGQNIRNMAKRQTNKRRYQSQSKRSQAWSARQSRDAVFDLLQQIKTFTSQRSSWKRKSKTPDLTPMHRATMQSESIRSAPRERATTTNNEQPHHHVEKTPQKKRLPARISSGRLGPHPPPPPIPRNAALPLSVSGRSCTTRARLHPPRLYWRAGRASVSL